MKLKIGCYKLCQNNEHIGKFWEVDTCGETPEEYAEWYMKQNQKTVLPPYYDTWVEYLLHYNDYQFIMLKGKLYKLSIENELDESNFCVIHKETDGSYSFATSFYDGGTYLEEVLTDEFEKI